VALPADSCATKEREIHSLHMPSFKNLFRRASLRLVDGLVLALGAAALAYFSVAFLLKMSTGLAFPAAPSDEEMNMRQERSGWHCVKA
jgi:hypothetical protein